MVRHLRGAPYESPAAPLCHIMRQTELNIALHGGRIGKQNITTVETTFALFYSFELKLCKMVKLCIPKNPMFFGFQMAKQINNF